MPPEIRVTIWNEFLQELAEERPRAVYPEGIHRCLAHGLAPLGPFALHTATLREPDQGLPPEVLERTEVLVWWGHRAHREVADATSSRVADRVRREGMGFVALHSAHFSKPFLALMGTPCTLRHRVAGETEILRVADPAHPVAQGLPESFTLAQEEMYGEPFAVPDPEATVLTASFAGGEHFRAGCAWQCGAGRVFYFQPGHELYPAYRDPWILQVIANAILWTARRI